MKKVVLSVLMSLALLSLFACSNGNSYDFSNEQANESEDKKLSEANGDNIIYNLEQGMTMPNIKVETNKGVTFDLQKAKKPVLINFWATWCPPCREEMPGLQNLYEKYKDKVDFVMINLGETKEIIQDFLVENEIYTFPIGYDKDGALGIRFNIMAIPDTIIVGKDKIIKNFVVGARSEAQFDEYLDAVTKE